MASKQRCLFCGEPVGEKGYCTGCRLNQRHLIKAFNTSIYHYNRGYEKAIERDISGAISSLQTALRYNKQNINARNLLGLCYYEIGETVSAMEHWVMSINYKPKDNDAARYLKELKDDEEELEMTGLSIKAYNEALIKAKKGDLDGALSDLRGSISNNPNYVRALLLYALILNKSGRVGLAKKALVKTLQIDRQNETAKRYLREMGISDRSVEKMLAESIRNHDEKEYYGIVDDNERTPVKIKPKDTAPSRRRTLLQNYQEKNLARNSYLYIMFGIVLGMLMLYFFIVPAIKKNNNLNKNDIKTQYSRELSDKNMEIEGLIGENESLKNQVSAYASSTDAMQQNISKLEERVEELQTALKQHGIGLDDDKKGEGSADGEGTTEEGTTEETTEETTVETTEETTTESPDGAGTDTQGEDTGDDNTTEEAALSEEQENERKATLAERNNKNVTGISSYDIEHIISKE